MRNVADACGTFAAVLLLVSTLAGAQTWKPPAESERCPSKWGAGDERGAANHMTPAAVLNAARLIRSGEVIELGRVLRAGMPIQTTRRFDLHTQIINDGTLPFQDLFKCFTISISRDTLGPLQ